MKIAYVVDVHGHFSAVPEALGRIGDVDLLIIGGDITTGGTPDDAERAIRSWSPLAPQLVALAGNMDSPAIDARLVSLGVGLGGIGYSFDDVGVFGLSGAPLSPLKTPYEVSDEDLQKQIEAGYASVKACRLTVFCPHAPPRNTNCDRTRGGQHVGSTVVRNFIEKEEPDFVLCGHIHESRGLDRIGSTQIANPGPVAAGHYGVVEIDATATVSLDP